MRYIPKDGDRAGAQGTFEVYLEDFELMVCGVVGVKMTYEIDYRGRGYELDGYELLELDIGYNEDGDFWKSDDQQEILICLALMESFQPMLAGAMEEVTRGAAEETTANPPSNDWDF